MSDWREQLRAERERYRQETADEATTEERARREEDTRRFVRAPFLEDFDREFHAEFGRWPTESPLAGTSPVSDRRRAAIQALIDRGATEGERDAARAAMARLDAPDDDELARLERDRQDEEDFEEAMSHGAA